MPDVAAAAGVSTATVDRVLHQRGRVRQATAQRVLSAASRLGYLPDGDLRFEPRAALAAGADGLADLRTLVAGAPAHLRPNGLLAVEHGWNQGAAVRALMFAAGFVAVTTLRDAQQHDRITLGRIPANGGRSAVPGLE